MIVVFVLKPLCAYEECPHVLLLPGLVLTEVDTGRCDFHFMLAEYSDELRGYFSFFSFKFQAPVYDHRGQLVLNFVWQRLVSQSDTDRVRFTDSQTRDTNAH